MLVATRARLFRASRVLYAGGGGDAKPVWTLPAQGYYSHTYQPAIPDKHFFGAHWNYAPFTMWIRSCRPTLEEYGKGGIALGKSYFNMVYNPLKAIADDNLPGIGFKLVGLIGFCLGYNYIMDGYWEETDSYMFLEKMQQYKFAKDLEAKGFWNSESEDYAVRKQAHDLQAIRFNTQFDEAMAVASQSQSFDALVEALGADLPAETEDVPKPITWRFNMMPYGQKAPGNDDAHTFPWPSSESPASSQGEFMDLGSFGDYINRTDNKANPMRKARHLYATAYLPPTK